MINLTPFEDIIEKFKADGNYRVFNDILRERGKFPKNIWYGKYAIKEIVNWCSNDYLGMGQNPIVLNAMHEAIDATGAGSGGTRNISGTTIYHKRLEAELAGLHLKEEALLFTSAYVANDATLSTLPKIFPGLIIYSDALNHASMIEGVRRNGGAKRIFRFPLGPIKMTWVAEHLGYQPPEKFEDVMIKGPFKSWHHKHHFEMEADQT